MLSWIPRWTDNPNFNAQAAHFGVGFSVGVTDRTKAAHRPFVGILIGVAFLGYVAMKEFWYDAIYELPPQSTVDNVEDALWYTYGLMAGLLVGSL